MEVTVHFVNGNTSVFSMKWQLNDMLANIKPGWECKVGGVAYIATNCSFSFDDFEVSLVHKAEWERRNQR